MPPNTVHTFHILNRQYPEAICPFKSLAAPTLFGEGGAAGAIN